MNDMLQRAGLRAWRVGGFSRVIRPKTVLYSLSLTVLAIALLLFGVMQGSLPVPASAIGRAVFDPQALTAQQQYVVWDVRLPRLLMALLCGAMLGLAGAAMQSITRNGLADLGSSVSRRELRGGTGHGAAFPVSKSGLAAPAGIPAAHWSPHW